MKKIISSILVIAIVLAIPFAMADVDISGLSYEELVELVNEAQMLMMKSDKWQEVLVPEGVYEIGKDIPAGYWTISSPPKSFPYVGYGTTLEADGYGIDRIINSVALVGKESSIYNVGDTTEVSWELKDGQYIEIGSASVYFTPYKGNSFTFK